MEEIASDLLALSSPFVLTPSHCSLICLQPQILLLVAGSNSKLHRYSTLCVAFLEKEHPRDLISKKALTSDLLGTRTWVHKESDSK